MGDASTPTLSLVIPAHNEERYLPRLLDSVAPARKPYEAQGSRAEIVVADDASTDATPSVARDRGCVVASLNVRNIGAARNGGARLARGVVLVFSDADARLRPRTFVEIGRPLRSPRGVGAPTDTVRQGAFGGRGRARSECVPGS